MNSPSKEVDLRKNHFLPQLAGWTGAWLVTVALATFGPRFLWGEQTAVTLLAVVVSVLAGGGMLFASWKHLHSLDELQIKIQLEAMAIALGLALVGGVSYSLLDITNLIPVDAEIAFLVMGIGITYLISVVLGSMRYR